jgi:hypothetical protein
MAACGDENGTLPLLEWDCGRCKPEMKSAVRQLPPRTELVTELNFGFHWAKKIIKTSTHNTFLWRYAPFYEFAVPKSS